MSQSSAYQSRYFYFICLLGMLMLLPWGMQTEEVIGFDSRFYLFAKEMWESGMTWFPTTYHEPYPDYPVTSIILIYVISLFSGGLNKFIAILPTASMAFGTVVVTYLIGRLHDERWGVAAALLLLLTNAFVINARAISLDMGITLITTICFYLIYSAKLKNSNERVKWVYLGYLLGFALRGPIGLVIPTGVVSSVYLLQREYRQFIYHGLLASLLLAICTASLLLMAQQVGGHHFVQAVWRMQIAGRIDNPYLPRYFYLLDSMGSYALAYPLAIAALIAVSIEFIQTRKTSSPMVFLCYLAGWLLVVLLGLTFPDDKKVRYILPAAPAMALIGASIFVAATNQRYLYWLRSIVCFGLFCLPGLLGVGLAMIWQLKMNFLPVDINTPLLLTFFLLLQFVNGFISAQQWPRELAWLSVAVLCFYLLMAWVVEPIHVQTEHSRDFVTQVERWRLHDHARLVFYHESRDSLPIKYLVNMTAADQPVFLSNEQALLAMPAPFYAVTSESYYNNLSTTIKKTFTTTRHGMMGHVAVVVFGKH